MIPLDRVTLKSIVPGPVHAPAPGRILQTSLGSCPWRVAVASMLLCRTRRKQAEPALQVLLTLWPTAGDLARADTANLESVVRPCGLYRARARQLQRFSVAWLGDGWSDLRDLPGVGVYVADAVGLVCLGCKDLESGDYALLKELEHAA